ncbi:MAG: DUF285 domain-containing protein [Bacteroidaceae bacterium]|nr:DUF285 domain-containing protein [Bacteroidaceae bacterium]
MKKFFYMAVAALAALSSCSSDNDIIKEETVKQPLKFTATMEGSATRATLNAKKAQWEVDDQICINGKAYKATTAGASTTLEATGDEAELVDGKYKAYFPASMYDGSTVTLPASYSYTEGDGNFDMPMYAESSTTVLPFKNLCGVLAITVPQSEMTSVKSIEVSSDKQMNGAINSISDDVVLTFASSSPTDAEKKVTLTVSPAVSIPTDGSKTFYVPVPANTHNPLLITISGETETKAMITMKDGGVAVARSNIYPINFNENTNAWAKALQLGKTTATEIKIEADVTTLPTAEDETHKMLNNSGIVWEVLDGTTLRIQTSSPKIIGHGPFGEVGLFQGYSKVESITGLDKVDFSEVTDMSSMFNGCNALESDDFDLSSFNTSKVTRMSNMFRDCKKLKRINLSSFNTSNVTQMNNMFRMCNDLTSSGLNLSNFNTSKVTTMLGMFIGCNTLESLDLSNFDTQEVTDMSYMFYGCSGLKSSGFILSSFNTSKVTTMEAMFYNCQKLNYLNLSHFNTSNVTNTYTMFRNCYFLQTLTLSDNFVMTNVTNKAGMFADCGYSYGCKVYNASSDTKSAFTEDGTNWSSKMSFGN